MLQDNYLRSADPNIQSKEAVLRKVQVSKIEDFLGLGQVGRQFSL